ncbi:MAG: putative DNA binding domain-containing protein [Bacteroidales bacterium]|nr:putative DNA binding domain-containing protein [Candidatus Colicola coprequi]
MIMKILDIENIIKGDETRLLGLKKTTGELKDGMHSLCAFLNTDGGYLIFGITPTTLKFVGA